jgi:hypothetical protein
MKIITHSGVGHADDFLAVSLLLHMFPEATVERVSELPNKIEEDAFVVDIGGKYEPPRFLDHHQNSDIPSSFMLVLKEVFGISNDFGKDLAFYDLKDRYGVTRACQVLEVKNDILSPIESAIISVWSSVSALKPGDPLHVVMQKIGENIVKAIRAREETKLNLMKSEKISIKEGVIIFYPESNPNVGLIKEFVPKVIGIVKPNSRVPTQTDIVSVDNNALFRPESIVHRAELNPVFLHKTGFMAVVDKPLSQVKKDIVKALSS